MSLNFYTLNDFIGEINLSLSNDTNVQAQFEAMANQIGDDILRDLLNDKLYTDLIADLDGNGNPQTQPYIDLVDGITYIDDNQETIAYQGLKRMLRYFVWEQTLMFTRSSNSTNGQEVANSENAVKLTRFQLRKEREPIQNKAVDLYHDACKFIDDNYEDFLTANDYSLWKPKRKTYLGKIITVSPRNQYFYKRSTNKIKWPT
jgi:hypothetical protein